MALGVFVLLLIATTVVISLGVAIGAAWARVCAIAMEAVVALVALARFRVHPFVTLLAIAYAGTVVALLWWSAESNDDSPRPSTPAELGM